MDAKTPPTAGLSRAGSASQYRSRLPQYNMHVYGANMTEASLNARVVYHLWLKFTTESPHMVKIRYVPCPLYLE